MGSLISPLTKRKSPSSHLGTVGVLIADDDTRIAIIVRDVLKSLGFRQIYMASNGQQALEVMRNERVNMVITDWKMDPMDGINLVQYLRTSADSPNRFVPIIMLTGNVERVHVEIARDAGVTEFMVKPFSPRSLCDRIVRLIENPRSFIMTKVYVGPDRRRRSASSPPDGTEEKRKRN